MDQHERAYQKQVRGGPQASLPPRAPTPRAPSAPRPHAGHNSVGNVVTLSVAPQTGVNVGFRKAPKRVPGKYGLRYYKNVGLGFRTPKEAVEGEYPRAKTVASAQRWMPTTGELFSWLLGRGIGDWGYGRGPGDPGPGRIPPVLRISGVGRSGGARVSRDREARARSTSGQPPPSATAATWVPAGDPRRRMWADADPKAPLI